MERFQALGDLEVDKASWRRLNVCRGAGFGLAEAEGRRVHQVGASLCRHAAMKPASQEGREA